jgi:hypothetical protein
MGHSWKDANRGRLEYGTAAWGIHGTMQIEGECSMEQLHGAFMERCKYREMQI